MKKFTLLLMIAVLTGLCQLLVAVDKEQTDMWLSILTDKEPQSRIQKLDAYQEKYGAKDDKISPFMWMQLAYTAYLLQQFDKTINAAEKSLTYKEVETNDRMRLYLYLANAYYVTKKDLGKSYEYANLLIDLARSLKGGQEKAQGLDNQYIAPALRIQIKILEERTKDLKNTQEALAKAIEAYKMDRSTRSGEYVIILGNRIYKLGQLDAAIMALETVMSIRPTSDTARVLAYWLDQKGNKEKALEYLKTSYKMKKSAKVAFDIGALLQKNDLDSSINYLAESVVLNDRKYSPKAQELLEHLFFNVKAKGMLSAEQEKAYQEILAAAKSRLGL